VRVFFFLMPQDGSTNGGGARGGRWGGGGSFSQNNSGWGQQRDICRARSVAYLTWSNYDLLPTCMDLPS